MTTAFTYSWGKDNWILHVALRGSRPSFLHMSRKVGDRTQAEEIRVSESGKRVLITRRRPEEEEICFRFDESVLLEVFEVCDRAHFPTSPIYVSGLEAAPQAA
jgi:hypothetical protein